MMARWPKAGRDQTRTAEGVRSRTTCSYADCMYAIRHDTVGHRLYPWTGRFPTGVYTVAERFTRSRKMLVGHSGDAIYLGERVSRQHGPEGTAMIPDDPPADLWLPRSFDHAEQLRLIRGIDCGQFMHRGDYQAFIADHLRLPQMSRGETSQRREGVHVENPVMAPPYLDVPMGDRTIRVGIDTQHV